MVIVHNQFPERDPGQKRLAIVGAFPGQEDVVEQKPFAGGSGRFLKAMLSSVGVNPNNCFYGNVCQSRPPQGNIYNYHWHEEEIQGGIHQLRADLAQFKPNCVALLGEVPCKAFGETRSIVKTRGTIFQSATIQHKCVMTYAPMQCLRNYSWTPFLKFDLHRAYEECTSPVYRPPKRNIITRPSISTVLSFLDALLGAKKPISFDLEGYPDSAGVKCVGLSNNWVDCVVIPFRYRTGGSYWTLEEECMVWKKLAEVLESDIPKIAQNGMYELFVFAWRHGIFVRNLTEDTMYKHWELYCEFDKNLGVIASLYTREPYFKDEISSSDEDEYWLYNGKDVCVTGEASDVMQVPLSNNSPSEKHYRFNIRIQRPYFYMQLRGCKIDQDLWKFEQQRMWHKIQMQQAVVNAMTGREFNVKSNPQKLKWLYEDLKLPVQKKKNQKGSYNPTADEPTLCKLYVDHQIPAILEVIKHINLRTRFSDLHKLQPFPDGRIRCNYNPVATDTGRLNSTASNVVGPMLKALLKFKKGELVLDYKKAIESYGTNLQNQTKALRKLFVPDSDDFVLGQWDLSGADAWTVGADLAALGHPLMLEHLKRGIKPSKLITLVIDGHKFDPWDFDAILELQDLIKKTDWRYTCSKRCQHGTNYNMKDKLTAQVLLKDSVKGWVEKFLNDEVQGEESFIMMSPHEVRRYQRIYSDMYNLPKRKEWIESELRDKGYIDHASGHRRRFMAIRNKQKLDWQLVNAALSDAPQGNTTYATNLAAESLYFDLENRTNRGWFRVEPNIMVHDALVVHTHKSQIEWAEEKIRNEWFNHELIIHDIPITIPVEGGWGKTWKDCD